MGKHVATKMMNRISLPGSTWWKKSTSSVSSDLCTCTLCTPTQEQAHTNREMSYERHFKCAGFKSKDLDVALQGTNQTSSLLTVMVMLLYS